MKFSKKQHFIEELVADANQVNSRRSVENAHFSFVEPKNPSNPELIHVSDFRQELGISEEETSSKEFLDIVAGNRIATNSKPYSMAYAGHQFGNWAGQLGDGRAINLGEIIHDDKSWVLQLKGAGETPFSRTADGLAVLRSSIREYLCSEAMFHLGIATTRALSLVTTGDKVLRDVMYDGNPELEKGAIVCRVAPSFLRFGNYELFASRKDYKNLKLLVDFTLKNHFSHLGNPSKETYLAFFEEVCESTLEMVVNWQRVGFVHGVMNTDNMSILGLTIDYGPYGWLEGFDYGWTPNTTDRQFKRYRYGNQPNICLWNLYQLANALFPLIEEVEPLQKILNGFNSEFEKRSLEMMRSKLGLMETLDSDKVLINKLEENLQLAETDMTIFFRKLSDFSVESSDGLGIIKESFYNAEALTDNFKSKWNEWFADYEGRLSLEKSSTQARKQLMDSVNPKYVLRNYMAQLAIDQAEKGNYDLLDELYLLLKRPYDEQPENQKWFSKRPEWARNKVGCSMLSCSS
ncbi:Uncharacterized conserved protein YdiU, UPF0061 family [Flavobacteriaceae bacterium MAR_2010_188]|nr:Uncharacterized conserved protein YdiU, UPF0061 family [Flavobacteriaceae bacterium MAR_2010_188]